MREQTGAGLQSTTPPRQTTWLSSTQPGRTSTGTYAGIPAADAAHSTVVIRNNPRSAQPYRRDVQVNVHNGPPPSHIQQRASMSASTTRPPGYYEDDYEEEEQLVQRRPGKHRTLRRPVLIVAFLIACYLIYFLGCLIFDWVQNVSDDIHYGTPRTYQTDRDVGHGGISHFTVEDLNGHIIVIELPDDDPSKTLVYSGPTFSDANIPAIVTFKTDATTGKVTEMDIDVNNTQIPFINGNDGKFHS